MPALYSEMTMSYPKNMADELRACFGGLPLAGESDVRERIGTIVLACADELERLTTALSEAKSDVRIKEAKAQAFAAEMEKYADYAVGLKRLIEVLAARYNIPVEIYEDDPRWKGDESKKGTSPPNFIEIDDYIAELEKDQARKAELDQARAELRERTHMNTSPCCRGCGGQGWYMRPNINTGEPEQVQCECTSALPATGTLPPDMVLMPRTPTVGMLNALFGGELNERGLAEYRSRWLDLLTEIDSTHAVDIAHGDK